ncbi:MAG: 23S rRNA (uracil(1939)-C(5))-methyltransferase RlmD [Desulfuromonas sp.]|nr:MAG: 23S rRNA (uracil(1939)-C(5))-methyltransferase RlmD [Desulfuromonas sp.]
MSRTLGPLQIDSLAYGGKGVARADGKVIFVAGGVPGDRVICRLSREKKRFAEAELVELVEASAIRRRPPCPVADQCGGCQWQQLPYPEQCRWKELTFADLLLRQAGVPRELILPIMPAPGEWNYRSRVQFKCFHYQGRFLTGFYRPNSHFVVDIDNCPVVANELNRVLVQLKSVLSGSPSAAVVPQIDMALGADQQVRVVIHALSGQQDIKELCRPLAEQNGFSLFLQSGRKETLQPVFGSSGLPIEVDEPPLRLEYGAGGFAQINLQQNRCLVDAVIESARLSGTEQVLDLFCGMGNFSLPLARRAAHVVAVEEYPLSIDYGKKNAKANGIRNVTFLCQASEGFLCTGKGTRHFDLVLLDPPRSGAYAIMPELLRHRPQRIIYISCDPATLARDLKFLLHGGYRLVSTRPFDMFPQTYHIESLTVLELDS